MKFKHQCTQWGSHSSDSTPERTVSACRHDTLDLDGKPYGHVAHGSTQIQCDNMAETEAVARFLAEGLIALHLAAIAHRDGLRDQVPAKFDPDFCTGCQENTFRCVC